MADLAHNWGSDLSVGPTGDIATADLPALGQQRVLRRLLTNGGDYIWQLRYGAGLPQFVGQPAQSVQMQAVIHSQLFAETCVATAPEPAIDVASDPAGTVSVQLRYTDALTTQTQLLSFSVDA